MLGRVHIINGPNLNLLGDRQPDIYGHETLEDVELSCRTLAATLDIEIETFQSNHEGAIVDAVQAARDVAGGIIINPAAYTHTSVAILDALNAFDGRVIEVHLSNIHKREAYRHHSYISARADAVIAGCGVQGYELALLRMARLLAD